jgi:hypothetical protein
MPVITACGLHAAHIICQQPVLALSYVLRVDISKQPTCMWAEELVLNDCCQWQAVKQVCQDLPDARASVLAQALLIEAVDLQAM